MSIHSFFFGTPENGRVIRICCLQNKVLTGAGGAGQLWIFLRFGTVWPLRALKVSPIADNPGWTRRTGDLLLVGDFEQ